MVSGGRVPMARWGEPEDIGRVVLALASGAMPYVTGQASWVAGGVNIARIV